MEEFLELIARHKYLLLFGFVFAEQIGLPLPAIPILLAGGVLARNGQLHPVAAVAVAVAAAVLSDVCWYELGRRRGSKVLSLLCRISLEPDSCVRQTENLFARHGARSLLIAKFVPGYSTVAPPLAGIFGMRLGRFLLFDALGAVLWIAAAMALGFVFANQLERLVESAAALGGGLGVVVLAALAIYILWKYVQRRRFLRHLHIARITPEELNRRLAAGEDVVVVDLRHSLEFEADPETIPGAVHVPSEKVEERSAELPRDREIVLFCT